MFVSIVIILTPNSQSQGLMCETNKSLRRIYNMSYIIIVTISLKNILRGSLSPKLKMITTNNEPLFCLTMICM